MAYFRLNSTWQLKQQNSQLQIHGGQDAVYTIDLDDNQTSFFGNLKPGIKFSRAKLSPQDKIVFEQLLSAGVILPFIKPKTKIATVMLAGDKFKNADHLSSKLFAIDQGDLIDLVVLVRIKQSLGQFLNRNNYLNLKTPHLFLDLAYHHTISLGPLVIPGSTACIACLEGRLKTRWGDELPPPTPGSSVELTGFATEWLASELDKLFANEDYFLINKTVVFDAQSRSMTTNKLLPVPTCPYCQKNDILLTGKLEYTLAKDS